MTDVAPEAAPAVTVPSISTPAPVQSPVAEPNPLANAITSFIGSANVQKTLGSLQAGIALLTNAEGHTIGMKLGAASLGGVFAVAVHYIDMLRARIGR